MVKINKVKKVITPFIIIPFVAAFFLLSCGGGSGGGLDNGKDLPEITIVGTVNGTTAVAINEENKEVDRNKAVAGQFTLVLPGSGTYRIYFVINEETADERISWLYEGGSNQFIFDTGEDITVDLGFVDTDLDIASSDNNILSQGAEDGGENNDALMQLSFVGKEYLFGFSEVDIGDPQRTYLATINFYENGDLSFAATHDSDGELDSGTVAYDIDSNGVISVTEGNTELLSGWVSGDPRFIGLMDNYFSDPDNCTIGLGIAKGSGMDESTCTGTYRYFRIEYDQDGVDEAIAVEVEMVMDGSGSGTFEVLSHTEGETDSGDFSYVVTSEGLLTITGDPGPDQSIMNGIVSEDGGVFLILNTDGDEDRSFGIGIKESSSMISSNIAGTYTILSYRDEDFPENPEVEIISDVSFEQGGTGVFVGSELVSSYSLGSDGSLVLTSDDGDGNRGLVSSDGAFITLLSVNTEDGTIPPANGLVDPGLIICIRD